MRTIFCKLWKAKELSIKDTDYVVRDNEVMIVDEFTGRLMQGRRWSDGLHQAIEAKENVPIQDETQTPCKHYIPKFVQIVSEIIRHDRYQLL